jgi:hypothetical protein
MIGLLIFQFIASWDVENEKLRLLGCPVIRHPVDMCV